jgi:hypothetical protein
MNVQQVKFLDLQVGDIICWTDGTPILLITELEFVDRGDTPFNKIWKHLRPNIEKVTHEKVVGFIFTEPDEDGDLTYESNVLYMINTACSLGQTWGPAFMLRGEKRILADKELFYGGVWFSSSLSEAGFTISIVPRG